MTAAGAPRSCASCGETGCAMNRRHAVDAPPAGRTAYVMDDVWPEYASMVAASLRAEDQLLAPGLLGARPPRYRLARAGAASGGARHRAPPSRHAPSRPGRRRHAPARLSRRPTAHVARALARAIDYRAGHLVVAQAWLPWLDEAGMLGGRSYDVAMSRYPLRRNPPPARRSRGRDRPLGDHRRFPRRSGPGRPRGRPARPRPADRHAASRHRRAFPGAGDAARLAPPAGDRAQARRSSRLPRPDHRPPAARHRPRPRRRRLDAPLIVFGDDARRRRHVGRPRDRAARLRPLLARWHRRHPPPGHPDQPAAPPAPGDRQRA